MDHSIVANARQGDFGKSAARKARKAGRVPAVLYGPEVEPLSLEIDPDELVDVFHETQDRNTIVQVQVGDTTFPCLVREVQRHPVSRAILHVDLYRVPDAADITVLVPVKTSGRAVGEIVGGRIRTVRRELAVKCNYRKIPQVLTVDVSALDVGDVVRVSQVPMPEGTALVFDKDFVVVSCYGKRVATTPAAEVG